MDHSGARDHDHVVQIWADSVASRCTLGAAADLAVDTARSCQLAPKQHADDGATLNPETMVNTDAVALR